MTTDPDEEFNPSSLSQEERRKLLSYLLSNRFSVNFDPLVHANLIVWGYIKGGRSKTETCEWLVETAFRERRQEFNEALEEYSNLVGLSPEEVKVQAFVKSLSKSGGKRVNPFDLWEKDKETGLYIRS
jgi:hypothetical protein